MYDDAQLAEWVTTLIYNETRVSGWRRDQWCVYDEVIDKIAGFEGKYPS